MAGVGAYCGASMVLANYNSLRKPPQVFVKLNETFDLIRKREPLEDLWRNEIIPEDLK
jgi:hypothetical protein